jgi:hypothetical protein
MLASATVVNSVLPICVQLSYSCRISAVVCKADVLPVQQTKATVGSIKPSSKSPAGPSGDRDDD